MKPSFILPSRAFARAIVRGSTVVPPTHRLLLSVGGIDRCSPSLVNYNHQIQLVRRFSLSRVVHEDKEEISSKDNVKKEKEKKPIIKKKKTISQRLARAGFYMLATVGFGVTTLATIVIGIFIYDSTTYADNPTQNANLAVPLEALYPKSGGPKNLPIADRLLSDNDTYADTICKEKPHLVVLGCGWGSVALLKKLTPGDYHVTVVSPRNYFLFTPLLPSAVVGTVSLNSLLEPIRAIVEHLSGHFLEARADKIEFNDKLVEVSQIGPDGKRRSFYVPYDKLVIACGSTANTHSCEGLENSMAFKTANDARKVRQKIVQNLELACMPSTSNEERQRLLSLVICGGGPTGVELAAEIYDLFNEDLGKVYPRILQNQFSVHIIQSRSHILNTYDEKISQFTEARYKNDQIDVLTNSRVVKIEPHQIVFKQLEPNGDAIVKTLPFGICLWSTGITLTPLTESVVKSLPDYQKNRHAIETDNHLRVIGAPLGQVYAIGDCSTVRTDIAGNVLKLIESRANAMGINNKDDIKLGFSEWKDVALHIRKKFPESNEHLKRVDLLFDEYDLDKNGSLDYNELKNLMNSIDKKITSLPATAQRANQQGIYLGKKFTKLSKANVKLGNNLDDEKFDLDSNNFKPFKYHHLGSLAYVGNAAVFDLPGYSYFGGLVAMYLWRSVYFAQCVGIKTRVNMAIDWIRRGIFGRDMLDY